MSLLHGDLIGAWRHNPIILVCYVGTLILNLYAACVLLFHFPRLRLAHLPSRIKRGLCALVVLALATNWIYLLANH